MYTYYIESPNVYPVSTMWQALWDASVTEKIVSVGGTEGHGCTEQ